MIEYLAAVDSIGFNCFLVWEKAHHNQKYDTRPDKIVEILEVVFDYFSNFKKSRSVQPFIFYLDARFGSFDLVNLAAKYGFKLVMSISAKRKPQELWNVMKEELEKREWRTVFYPEKDAYVVVVRPKRKTYLRMIATYGSANPITAVHRRRKFPRGNYDVIVPEVQQDYNANKNCVDNWNKRTLTYAPEWKFVSPEHAYVTFFVQAFTVNAYLYWRAITKSEEPQLFFRLLILDAIFPRLVKPVQFDTSKSHYPVPLKKKSRSCDRCQSTRRPWRRCEACNLDLCQTCMDEQHGIIVQKEDR